MATGVAETHSFPESLMCPLCLDVFERATLLLCGHTFCKECLREFDASRQDEDHMVCPVCRKHTKLQENRVEGLPANVTVNGLVDDYRTKTVGPRDSHTVRAINCTMCPVKGDAVSFCKECNQFMCDTCDNGYHQLSAPFANHLVLSTSARVVPKTVPKQIRATHPTLRVKKAVLLEGFMFGMTVVSDDAVVIGYNDKKGASKVDSWGNISAHFPRDQYYYDLAHQSHTGNTVVSKYGKTDLLRIYSQNGSYVHSKKISSNLSHRITSNDKDEIIIANKDVCTIMIYDPSISTELCRIRTKYEPWQAFETRSGAIIASTCCSMASVNTVTAYDRSGRVGDTLTAVGTGYLYAAVDSQDRVYVADVIEETGNRENKLVITQYKMDGLKFKKVFQFEELELNRGHPWCYMLSLSCDMLAFARNDMLYFIEVQPS